MRCSGKRNAGCVKDGLITLLNSFFALVVKSLFLPAVPVAHCHLMARACHLACIPSSPICRLAGAFLVEQRNMIPYKFPEQV
jgi:hypothetical protein